MPGGDLSMIACVSWNVISTRLVLLREARLRVAGEVDEVPEHREDLVVLGELRAQRDAPAALPIGQKRVEHGDDLAAVDAALVVDVVDVRLVVLVLVDADRVDELLDAVEVDERDADLDRRSASHRRPVPSKA